MKNYEDMAREILRERYPEWTVVNEAVLCCPHGHRIEYDGTCPEGCRSPFLKMGMI